jgi:hypothetical protein
MHHHILTKRARVNATLRIHAQIKSASIALESKLQAPFSVTEEPTYLLLKQYSAAEYIYVFTAYPPA